MATPEEAAAAEAAAKVATEAADAKMREMVQGAVRTSIEGLVKEGQMRQAESDAQAAADKAAKGPTEATALGDLFKPALEPAMNAARNAETRAVLAADAVDFYTTHASNPTVLKYKGRIEEVIGAQLKRGNLISRKDAWNWLRGGELYEELGKDALSAHERKLAEAREAATAGPSVSTPKFAKPLDELKTDELGEALKGVTF